MPAIDKKRIWILIASGAAVLAGLMVWIFLHHLEETYQEAGETVSVLVAGQYIPRGTPLSPTLFQTARIPKAYVDSGALNNFEVLESSPGHPSFRCMLPIPEGTQLVQRELAPISQGEALSQVIPDNLAAVSFGVDVVRGIGGNIQPGDLIDILHTPKPSQLGEKPVEIKPRATATLFQAVTVIAVGKKWAAPSRMKSEEEKEKDERPEKDTDEMTVLTVVLNPVAAVDLTQARENETLSVVLRAPGDTRVLEKLSR